MRWARKFASAAAVTVAVPVTVAGMVASGPAGAQAATTTLCNSQTATVAGGSYTVQNNEWGSSAPECATTDGGADFTVANSSIDNSTSSAPGGYPSIYQGCHWGDCTSGGLAASPVQVSSLTPGKVTTSWDTTQPGGSSDYDVAYDIWFNQTPTTTTQPNCTELMVWLNHNGPVQPFGSQVATAAKVGGRSYNVWFGKQAWNTVSYTMTTPSTSVRGLDIGQLAADAVSRGYIQKSWYLIDVEAGFELWQGGTGLAADAFAVNVHGAPVTALPSAVPSAAVPSAAAPSATAPVAAGGSSKCSAAYSVANSWPGGFQGQVILTNTGSSAIQGWTLGWTFPGDQKITGMWNGTRTQSGERVTVTNASYDQTIAPSES
ncbi:MAG TPA: cellulose binding domain-containing protein, partial [Streptosporangiaceae bacterium]|nr:cellulose binding domain-containing protein [Streptosporangiaceae bacterium]